MSSHWESTGTPGSLQGEVQGWRACPHAQPGRHQLHPQGSSTYSTESTEPAGAARATHPVLKPLDATARERLRVTGRQHHGADAVVARVRQVQHVARSSHGDAPRKRKLGVHPLSPVIAAAAHSLTLSLTGEEAGTRLLVFLDPEDRSL